MIRNNKNPKVKLDQQREIVVNYRNAVYQGQYDRHKSKRQGRGIIYLPSTHHFIACSSFIDDKIWGQSVFFHSHSQFHYGAWRNNTPHGVCVFKIGQILIITQFSQGKIPNRTNILFILQKSCTGLIVEIIDDNKWQIRSKHDAYSSQQLQDLLHQCGFKDKSQIPTSLVKFLNGQFHPKNSETFKLRLIGNKFYRFGFKNGFAVFFDDQYRLITVGQHKKDELVGLGAKFSFQQKENRIQQGIFDGHNTYFYQPNKKPVDRLHQLYNRALLSGIQFKNVFYSDPSQQYFDFFTQIINHPEFQDLASQISQQFESKQDFSKNRPKFQYPDLDKYQKIDMDELSIPSLTKNNKNNSFHQRSKEYNEKDKLVQQKGRSYERTHSDHNSFELLQEKNRLQIIKKQIHQYITPKKYPSRQSATIRQSQYSDIFGIKFDKNKIEKEKEKQKQDLPPVFQYIPDRTPPRISKEKKELDYTGNLQQKIDILINGQQPEPQKRKNKIFDQSRSIKKDYSPQGQPSPFKSRMRARIFDPQISKSLSKSKSRSRKKIYSKEVTSSRLTHKQKKNNEYLSPHQQLGISLDKSSNQSRIASYPVTMQKGAPMQKVFAGEDIQDQDSSNMKLIKTNNYGRLKENRQREDQLSNFRKSNQVYRNPMIKGNYNEYVYEPINVAPANNSPYLKNQSMKSLTKIQSKDQLADNNTSSKKIIGQTSPLKKHKMGRYLNQDEGKQPGSIYSDYKKRSFYF